MLAVGMILGYTMSNKSATRMIDIVNGSDQSSSSYGVVEDMMRRIESRYVDSIDRAHLMDVGIRRIVSELDPHSIYIDPDRLGGVKDDMRGSYKGIGIETKMVDDTLYVVRVMKDSPGGEAGIKQFDQILEINGTPVSGPEHNKVQRIRDLVLASNNDMCDLKIKRKLDIISSTVSMDEISSPSISSVIAINDSTLYFRIDKFAETTFKEFMKGLEAYIKPQQKLHLILDLQGNPGGYLPEATKILNQFFTEKDKLLVYTEGLNNSKHEYETTGKPFFIAGEIAVLIDERSASGSEIIAGAIQDWDRGIVIGRRTFGKGLVQEQYNLSNGGALRLTVARYYTPSGRSIQRSYEDKEAYESEYSQRVLKGDKQSDYTYEDTTTYRSLNLGRRLYGGSGITPDVFIPRDDIKVDSAYEARYDIMYKTVLKEYAHVQKENIDPTLLKSKVCDDIVSTGRDCKIHQEQLYKEMEDLRISMEFGKDSLHRLRLLDDKVLQSALDYLNGNIELERLTPIAEK